MTPEETGKAVGIITAAVIREAAARDSDFHLAKMEYARGGMTDEELNDYKEDALNGQNALELWTKIKQAAKT